MKTTHYLLMSGVCAATWLLSACSNVPPKLTHSFILD